MVELRGIKPQNISPSSPVELTNFMANFWAQPEVHKSVMERFEQAKKRDPKVTVEEAAEAFSRTNEAEQLMFKFYASLTKSAPNGRLRFSERGLSGKFTNERTKYFDIAATFNDLQCSGTSNSRLQEVERMRSAAHTAAAETLVQDRLVPSSVLAKTVLQFMSVAAGVDGKVDPLRSAKQRQAISHGW
jgi:hypothetical protein